MILATLSCLSCLFGAYLLTRTRYPGHLFNPLIAFFGIWTLNLITFAFDGMLHLFYVGLSVRAALMLSLSFLCYFAGGGAAMMGQPPSESAPVRITSRQLNALKLTTAIMTGVFLLGVGWKYHIVSSVYGSPWRAEELVRVAVTTHMLTMPTLSGVMTLFGYVVALNVGVLLVFRPHPWWLAALAVLVAAIFVNDSTEGARGSTINMVLILLCTIVYSIGSRTGRVGVKHLAGVVTAVIGAIVLLTPILYLRSSHPIGFVQRLLIDNYMYFVGTIPSLSAFLEHPWPITLPGQWTFAGLYQIIDILSGRRFAVLGPATFATQYASITSVGPFNSSAYLAYFYSDFGVPGVVILSAAMGFLATYAFTRVLRRKRLIDIQLGALLMFLVVYTIRGIGTNGVPLWFCLGVVMIQWWWIRDRSGSVERTAPVQTILGQRMP